MAAFQQFNESAIKVLSTQRQFAASLANHPNEHLRRDFYLNENYGEQPGQRRATALPKTAQLIKDGWNELFPVALKKSGATKMRTYLRELSKPHSPLKEMAMPRLAEVDQILIKYYFAQAKVLLKKHDFARTRKKYKQIIAEYPDSDASRRAERELPKVVPVAVKFYKTEGEKNFNPGKQFGVPQTKARENFEKMYKETAQSDMVENAAYALYHWARALATEGKYKEALQKLHEFEERFSGSKLRSKALFLEGFLNGDSHVKKISVAAQLMEQTAQQYPKSDEAPEALWYGAFYYAELNQFPQAIACLDKLEKYPKSKRVRYVKQWRNYFEQKIREGSKWP